jgi:Fur family ferric uptake transcriptional regulator
VNRTALRTAHNRLRATGARVTSTRVRVLAALVAAQKALSRQDVERALAERLDRVTLYRVLDWLVERGLAHRAAGEDRVWRFMAGEPHADHAHFHCRQCDAVLCLRARAGRAVRLPRGFRGESIDLTVHGLCAECARVRP